MTYFIRDIIGAEILLFDENARLGPVLDLIFSPDDGSVLGFLCFDPIAKKNMVFVPSAVRNIEGTRILIDGHSALADMHDLVRVAEAAKVNAKIVGERVITESGQRLGKVTAATVDTKQWRLDKLYVDSSFSFNLLTKELLIPASKIVKIEKKKIYVVDSYAKFPARAPRPAKALK